MSPEQVFQASLPSKCLGGRLAWKTCLKDLLGVIGRLVWCAWKTCLEVFQASLPTTHLGGCGAVHPQSRGAVRQRGIFLYVYIYIHICKVLPPHRLARRGSLERRSMEWMEWMEWL
jgi:hypothetical protein